jgi:hypothetical protein
MPSNHPTICPSALPPHPSAQIVAEHEDAAMPRELRAKPAPIEPELARLIRLGVAPYERLEAIVPFAFTDADMNGLNETDEHPVEALVARFTPVQIAQMEMDAKRSEGAAFAAVMDENSTVALDMGEDYTKKVSTRLPTESLTSAQMVAGEKIRERWEREGAARGERPLPETQREVAVHRHQEAELQLLRCDARNRREQH